MPLPLTVSTVTDGTVLSPLSTSAPVAVPVSLPPRVTFPVSLAVPRALDAPFLISFF